MNASFDVTGVTIETERLLLRPFRQTDLADFNAYAKVPGVGECAGWRHHETMEESQRILDLFLREKKTFALVEKATGHVIGSVGLENCRSQLPLEYEALKGREIGYVLAKDKWGAGLMTEAVKGVIAYAFTKGGLDFLVCAHFAWNLRSKRVIEKCGFRPVGIDVFETRYGTLEENHFYLLDNSARKVSSK